MSYQAELRIIDERNRASVAFACSFFKMKGIEFEYDDRKGYKCWDILTPIGWRQCDNAQELCAVVAELREHYKAIKAV